MKKRTTSVTVPSETGYRVEIRLAIAKGVTGIQCSQIGGTNLIPQTNNYYKENYNLNALIIKYDVY